MNKIYALSTFFSANSHISDKLNTLAILAIVDYICFILQLALIIDKI